MFCSRRGEWTADGHVADHVLGFGQWPEGGIWPRHGVTLDTQSNLFPAYARGANALEGFFTNKGGLHVQVDQPIESKLLRVGVDIRIGVIG